MCQLFDDAGAGRSTLHETSRNPASCQFEYRGKSCRDTFRLWLKYAADQLRRQPTELQVADLDADLISDFLTFVETRRGNGARSRNTRLSAIRSCFKYVAVNEPQLLYHCQQMLTMPPQAVRKRTIDYLARAEIETAIGSDLTTWAGRRDRTLLLFGLQTGVRVSELINLTCWRRALGTGAHVRCMGKGGKERSTLRKDCVRGLRLGSTSASAPMLSRYS
jgi:integrase/recombinase XerD